MSSLILGLLLWSLPGSTEIRLDSPEPCEPSDAQLFHYDDGTPFWLTWSGMWRGVWFDMDDFGAGGSSLVCDYTEFWFYHHSSPSWDTCLFCAQLWTGSTGGPETELSETTVVAHHYTACYAVIDPPADAGSSFWVLDVSSFSSGGWPPNLGDGTPQPSASHSFHSDDFELWEPWIIMGEPFANDYLIRAHGLLLDLDASTWAGIKGLFR